MDVLTAHLMLSLVHPCRGSTSVPPIILESNLSDGQGKIRSRDASIGKRQKNRSALYSPAKLVFLIEKLGHRLTSWLPFHSLLGQSSCLDLIHCQRSKQDATTHEGRDHRWRNTLGWSFLNLQAPGRRVFYYQVKATFITSIGRLTPWGCFLGVVRSLTNRSVSPYSNMKTWN